MIRLSDAYAGYGHGVRALRGVSLEVTDGEFLFVVGLSGAGKSTLVKLLTAELRPSSGIVSVNGFDVGRIKKRQVSALRRTLGVVYQDFRLIERMSVFENVAFAMRVIGVSNREVIRKRVMYVLNLVGLEGKAKSRPSQLSGGEQQRVVIARALVNNPGVILADEPTGNLDPERSEEILRLLERINSLGSTVIVITHERALVESFHKRTVEIEQGRIVSDVEL